MVKFSIDWSKGGEVWFVDDYFLSFSFVVVLVIATLFLFGGGLLAEEAEALEVLVKANLAWSLLHDILFVSLADLLVLLWLEDGQLLLLDPLSIEFRLLDWSLLLEVIADLNSLALVVLLEGRSLRFFDLLLDWLFGGCINGSFGLRLCFFGSLFDVLVLVELVLDVADVSPSSTFLARLVAKLTKIVTLCQFHSCDRGSVPLRASWIEVWEELCCFWSAWRLPWPLWGAVRWRLVGWWQRP